MTHDEFTAIRRLWASVLIQAFIDIRSKSKKKEAEHYRNEAQSFLADPRRFRMVCDLAGLDPAWVRRKYWDSFCQDGKEKSTFLRANYKKKRS